MASARRREDRVKRRLVAASPGAVALDDLDIVVAEPLQPLARDLDQLVLPLDPDHLVGNPADDRRRVARARTDLEHLVARLDLRRLDHQRDDVRLGDGLPGFDRQRVIVIGQRARSPARRTPRAALRGRHRGCACSLIPRRLICRSTIASRSAAKSVMVVAMVRLRTIGEPASEGGRSDGEDATRVFAGSIPANYDRYMVPLLFQPYAEQVAAARAGSCSLNGFWKPPPARAS